MVGQTTNPNTSSLADALKNVAGPELAGQASLDASELIAQSDQGSTALSEAMARTGGNLDVKTESPTDGPDLFSAQEAKEFRDRVSPPPEAVREVHSAQPLEDQLNYQATLAEIAELVAYAQPVPPAQTPKILEAPVINHGYVFDKLLTAAKKTIETIIAKMQTLGPKGPLTIVEGKITKQTRNAQDKQRLEDGLVKAGA